MHLKEINQVLAAAKQGEWIYAETDHPHREPAIKVTNGYWDKFWVCVWDIFSCGSSAQKTQKIVDSLFAADPRNCSVDFTAIDKMRVRAACYSNLSKVRLAWNKSIVAPQGDEVLSKVFNSPWLDEQMQKAGEVISLLSGGHPRFEEIGLQYRVFQEAQEAFKKGEPAEQAHLWAEAADALFILQRRLKCQPQEGDQTAIRTSHSSLEYQLEHWRVSPQQKVLVTAGQHRKRINYLEIHLDIEKFPDSEEERETFVQSVMTGLKQFVQGQRPSQRRPVSIEIPHIPFRHAEKARLVYGEVIQQCTALIEAHPEYFMHQASLYEEAEGQKHRGVCLSRVTGKGAQAILNKKNETFTPERRLRQGIQRAIVRVQETGWSADNRTPIYGSDLNAAMGIKRMQGIQRQLASLDVGTNCTLRLFGKEVGCHEEVIREAFPFLEALQAFSGTDERHLVNLDNIKFPVSIPPAYGEWILNALRAYAYTGEHPNLPTDCTKETAEAFRVYLQCVDYLSPGSV